MHPSLPVWATVRRAYSSYSRHFVDALRATWLWLIVVAPLSGISNWQQWSLAGAMANLKPGAPAEITKSTAMVARFQASTAFFFCLPV